MKNLNLILCMLVMSMAYSQDYNKWSIEPEFGLTKIRDITPVEPYNVDIGLRYMANTLFGVKLNGNYTQIKNNTNITYYSGGLHGIINVGRLLKFESFSNNYTILGGIGGTYTDSGKNTNNQILHRISNFHLSAFVDNEFKLSKKLFIRVGMDVLTGVNSRPFTNNISTATTTILNFNVGVTIALGKKEEHADWYIEKHISKTDTVYMKPTVIDKTITNTEYDCNCDYPNNNEYVFFDNDKYIITRDALNSITKIANILYHNDKKVKITGFASPPATDEYNLELAIKRCNSVKAKLISLGIEETRIIITPIGETDTYDSKNVDLARYVMLEIE